MMEGGWSRPRSTAMAGRRKAVATFCNHCGQWHPTHRAVEGLQRCEGAAAALQRERELKWSFPHIAASVPKQERR